MGDYGQYRKKKKAHQNLYVLRFLDSIVLIATLCCSGLLLLSYLAPTINPNTFWAVALLGLITPILCITDIVLLLYWLIRWRVYFFIPLVVLLLGSGNLSLFFRPSISRSYHEQEKGKNEFNIVSYNVMGFIDPHNDLGESALEEVLGFANTCKPDIFAIQEYQSTKKMPQSRINFLLSELPYKRINYKVQNRDSTGWGVALFSRYPIIRSQNIDFEDSNNSAMWADIVIHKDTIRVFNNHLQTTSINREDRDFITTREFVQSDKEVNSRRIKNIVGKLRNNYKIRARQADTIALRIAESPYPVIVCGDFNDTPMSYTYNTIRGKLKDSYTEKGRGITNTYRGLFNLFRIDYVLYSPELEATGYHTPQSDYSDHNPVVVSFGMVK